MSAPDLNIRHVAHLARLNLSEEEMETFDSQLSQVLEYVEQLKGVKVDDVEPMAHTLPVSNVLREDKARDYFTAKEALKNAPAKANDLFIVTKVVE